MSSGEKVTYNLRLAKHIERKMLADTCLRLNRVEVLAHFRYVGLGSFYFTDFALFHKRLGIADMVSIEVDEEIKERCERNKPFGCIDVRVGNTTDLLEGILAESDKRTILWLDYDSRLTGDKLSDVTVSAGRLRSGSLLIVSVLAAPGQEQGRVESIRSELPDGLVPDDAKPADFAKWKLAKYYRETIHAAISQHVESRTITTGEKWTYQQLFNFHYQDGKQMLTVGGIINDERDEDAVTACCLGSLHFVRHGSDEYVIDVPRLTYKEIKYLDAHMPCENSGAITPNGIPGEMIRQYAALYRYYPTFADADM